MNFSMKSSLAANDYFTENHIIMKQFYFAVLFFFLSVLQINAQTLLTQFPQTNGQVFTIVKSGNTVYIGGFFTMVGTETRNNVAAIDATTGAVLPWNPNASWAVQALAVYGGNVFIGGEFSTIGGVSRTGFAVVDATTAALQPWAPTMFAQMTSVGIFSFAIDGNILYMGGNFTFVSGQSRLGAAAFDLTTQTLTPFSIGATDGSANAVVNFIAVNGTKALISGNFQNVGGLAR
jgi:trimeric autotransporter adhesin